MKSFLRFNKPGYHLIFCMLIAGLFCSMSLAENANIKNKKLESVNLEITTHLGDQQSFVEQDIISFFISLDKSSFLYAFYQDASGHIFQLMPGIAKADHYFQPGFYTPFPAPDSSFQFVVQAPFGKEGLWLFASEQQQLKFKGKDTTHGLKKIKQSHAELTAYIKASSSRLFGSAQLVIHTRKRNQK